MQADFDETRLLSTVPAVEYFKFISDDVYISLIDRLLTIARGPDLIAVRDGFVYFNSEQFMAEYKQLFFEYMSRFGFKTQGLKMKPL